MVAATVSGIILYGDLIIRSMPVVLLRVEHEGTHDLPIFIGPSEAEALHRSLHERTGVRPDTTDLYVNILKAHVIAVTKVEITEIRDGTFIAILYATSNGVETSFDARPSDALSLALRFKAPIFVAEAVLQESLRSAEANAVRQALAEAVEKLPQA